MSYKGNDLDLRGASVASLREGGSEDIGVLPTWPPHPDVLRDSVLRDIGREGPIPVDHTVVAVCNAAYDAAAFHASREVTLQHLVYALTRIEAAREVLETHGVRSTELRREAAAAIAEAVPAGPGRAPRSSMELEGALRRAAGRAGQDSVPASVHDVLRVLLTYGRDTPATQLLLRSASDAEQLERWAAEPAGHLMGLHAGYGAASEQPVAVQQLMARLDAMEHRMQALVADVAADRKALLDLVAEIQLELRAGRTEGAAAPTALAAMGDKLEATNQAVAGLAERFEAIRVFSPADAGDLGSRLSALEGKLADQPSAIANAVSLSLSGRQPAPGEGSQAGEGLGERMSAVEDLLRGQTERMLEASKTHERDLGEIFEALVKLGTNQQTLAGNLEAWRLDSSGDISIVSNRLERLERTLTPAPPPPRQPVVVHTQPQEKGIKRWRVLPATWREDAAALRDSLRRPAKT